MGGQGAGTDLGVNWGRGDLAPVLTCFPEVPMLFWGGGGAESWDIPIPTSSPSGAQLLHIEGDWEQRGATRYTSSLPCFPITMPSFTTSMVTMSGVHQDALLWASPSLTPGFPFKTGMEATLC